MDGKVNGEDDGWMDMWSIQFFLEVRQYSEEKKEKTNMPR